MRVEHHHISRSSSRSSVSCAGDALLRGALEGGGPVRLVGTEEGGAHGPTVTTQSARPTSPRWPTAGAGARASIASLERLTRPPVAFAPIVCREPAVNEATGELAAHHRYSVDCRDRRSAKQYSRELRTILERSPLWIDRWLPARSKPSPTSPERPTTGMPPNASAGGTSRAAETHKSAVLVCANAAAVSIARRVLFATFRCWRNPLAGSARSWS